MFGNRKEEKKREKYISFPCLVCKSKKNDSSFFFFFFICPHILIGLKVLGIILNFWLMKIQMYIAQNFSWILSPLLPCPKWTYYAQCGLDSHPFLFPHINQTEEMSFNPTQPNPSLPFKGSKRSVKEIKVFQGN